MAKIENLVFQGGGVKGIAYTGAFEMLEKYGVLDGIKRVAGTSAGAIPALLIALRYNTSAMKEIIFNVNFKSLEDHFNPLRVITHYGLYKGDNLLHWLKNIIHGGGLNENATFRDMEDFGCRQLKVFASNLNEKRIQEFSLQATPYVRVAEAIRASMSIPLLFESWQFSDGIPNKHFYVDGGMVFNYPLTVFDQPGVPLDTTLGFHIDNLSAPHQTVNLESDELLKYIKTVFDMLLHSQIMDFLEDEKAQERTVRIDDYGIPATDFAISKEQQQMLYESGKLYTEKFLRDKLKLTPQDDPYA